MFLITPCLWAEKWKELITVFSGGTYCIKTDPLRPPVFLSSASDPRAYRTVAFMNQESKSSG